MFNFAKLPGPLLVWLVAAIGLTCHVAHAAQYHSVLGWESDGSNVDAYVNETTSVPASYTISGVGYSAQTFGSALDNGTAFAESAATLGSLQAATRITYAASLSGPAGGLVPVEVIVAGYAKGVGDGQTSVASFSMTASSGTLLSGSAAYGTGEAAATLSLDKVVMIAPDTDFMVTLNVAASTLEPYVHNASDASAMIDPQFIIDPAFAGQYHFVGLPTVSAVPEPAAWLLLTVGSAACALRRRACRAPASA